jgi:hypothetical protein
MHSESASPREKCNPPLAASRFDPNATPQAAEGHLGIPTYFNDSAREARALTSFSIASPVSVVLT